MLRCEAFSEKKKISGPGVVIDVLVGNLTKNARAGKEGLAEGVVSADYGRNKKGEHGIRFGSVVGESPRREGKEYETQKT